MWQRFELKDRAKDVVRNCYWAAVVVCLISALLAGEFTTNTRNSNRTSNSIRQQSASITEGVREAIDSVQDMDVGAITEKFGYSILYTLTKGLSFFLLMFGIGLAVIVFLVSIFIGFPLLIGSKRFFMESREGRTPIGTILYGFRSGQTIHIILVMFFMRLKIFLWSLLLVIPGIIKSYEYRLIPYILSENPEMETARAFELSKVMMNGQKWETFVLDLSFILWNLLGTVTCGLARVFYVNPYIASTNAELYAVLRADIINRGQANSYELPGFYPSQR